MIGLIRLAASRVPAGVWKVGIIAVLLLLLTAGIYWRHAQLQHSNELCRQENIALVEELARKDEQLITLRQSVATQNERLKDMSDLASHRQKLVAEARAQAERERLESHRTITQLNRETGESCMDGIDLIDRALELP